MRLLAFLLATSIGVLGTGAQGEPRLLENERINSATLRAWILEIEDMPCGRPYTGEPRYWQLVRLGLEHVSDLIELVDDATPTDARVCLVGGYFAVGDIALSAAQQVVFDLPSLELIAPLDSPRVQEIGFGVYWEHVRSDPANRQVLETQINEWFNEHRHKLSWKPDPQHPSGGYYELPEANDG